MIIILMGVSGCGKTTVGKLLAQKIGYGFYDADDFHSKTNVEKMRSGAPLTDEERLPWLASLADLLRENSRKGQGCILACSALRQSYRDILTAAASDLKFVYLKGSFEVIEERLLLRKDHYMNPVLLKSQFDALEEPAAEDALIVDAELSPEMQVNIMYNALIHSD